MFNCSHLQHTKGNYGHNHVSVSAPGDCKIKINELVRTSTTINQSWMFFMCKMSMIIFLFSFTMLAYHYKYMASS